MCVVHSIGRPRVQVGYLWWLLRVRDEHRVYDFQLAEESIPRADNASLELLGTSTPNVSCHVNNNGFSRMEMRSH